MRDALVIAGAAISSLLTTVWHHVVHRHREHRAHQEMCRHQFGEVYEVRFAGAARAGHIRYYQKQCAACDLIRDVNPDGSDYKPGQKEEND